MSLSVIRAIILGNDYYATRAKAFEAGNDMAENCYFDNTYGLVYGQKPEPKPETVEVFYVKMQEGFNGPEIVDESKEFGQDREAARCYLYEMYKTYRSKGYYVSLSGDGGLFMGTTSSDYICGTVYVRDEPVAASALETELAPVMETVSLREANKQIAAEVVAQLSATEDFRLLVAVDYSGYTGKGLAECQGMSLYDMVLSYIFRGYDSEVLIDVLSALGKTTTEEAIRPNVTKITPADAAPVYAPTIEVKKQGKDGVKTTVSTTDLLLFLSDHDRMTEELLSIARGYRDTHREAELEQRLAVTKQITATIRQDIDQGEQSYLLYIYGPGGYFYRYGVSEAEVRRRVRANYNLSENELGKLFTNGYFSLNNESALEVHKDTTKTRAAVESRIEVLGQPQFNLNS